MNTDDPRLAWITRYVDGTASAETITELEAALREDSELREWFLDYINTDLALNQYGDHGFEADILPFPKRKDAIQRWIKLAAAACLALLVIGSVWVLNRIDSYAVVVKSIGIEILHPGTEIRGSSYRLDRGILELKTSGGARVVIEAPAEFQFISAQELKMFQGRIAADVPDSAHGFTVLTPTGKAIDLGTQFGVDVPKTGQAEIHVFEGEVIAQSGSGDRSSLKKGQAFSLQNDGIGSNRDLRSGAFIMPEEMASFSLDPANEQIAKSQKMARQLRSDPALITFLDFENSSELSSVKFRVLQGRWPGSRALEFVEIGDHMSLDIGADRSWPRLTLAAWVRLDRLGAPYQSLLHTDGWGRASGQTHWMVTSLNTMRLALYGNQTEPFTEKGGYPNSRLSVLPETGRWAHLASVYDSEAKTVRFFLNGRFDNQVQQTVAHPARFGPSRIGNWDSYDRKLSGRIDELLILGRSMTDSEVLKLFHTGNPYLADEI